MSHPGHVEANAVTKVVPVLQTRGIRCSEASTGRLGASISQRATQMTKGTWGQTVEGEARIWNREAFHTAAAREGSCIGKRPSTVTAPSALQALRRGLPIWANASVRFFLGNKCFGGRTGATNA